MKILGFTIFIQISSFAVSSAQKIPVPDFKDISDDILKVEIPPEIKSSYPYYLSGYDYEGVPIWAAELGKWDTRRAAEGSPQLLKDFKINALQMLKRWSGGKFGKFNDTNEFLAIFDMEGYPSYRINTPDELITKLWIARQAEQALKNVKGVYFVNANYIFTNFFEIMKPLLGPEVSKIEIFGTNKNFWTPKLLKFLPKDQIPPWYGGSENHKPVVFFG